MPWVFESLGTRWEIDADLDPAHRTGVESLLEDYDRTWSRFRPDAATVALAARGGSIRLNDHTSALFEASARQENKDSPKNADPSCTP